MTVSMAAYAVLAVYAFLFGAVLALALWAARCAVRLLLPLPAEIPASWRARLPAVAVGSLPVPVARLLRFLGDFFSMLFVALALILFLFWKGDGIPRLFVLLAVAAGALALWGIGGRLLGRIELVLRFAVRYCLFWLLLPPLRLARRIGGLFLLFLKKLCHRLIKCVKRPYTNLASYWYGRRTLLDLKRGRIYRRLAAILKEEERM